MKGVDAIMHVASPCTTEADDPDELIGPAVAGTVGVLNSALRNGTTVRRIVVTSSCATVITAQKEFRVFGEKDWNDLALQEVEAKGRAAAPLDKYRASKTLAERAAWRFMVENRDAGFDLLTIHPPWVFGPPAVLEVSPEQLGSSMKEWWGAVTGSRSHDFLATAG